MTSLSRSNSPCHSPDLLGSNSNWQLYNYTSIFMNWIKSNPFVSALSGATLVICVALFFYASSGSARFEEAQAEFENSYAAVSKAERLKPYPIAENRDGKRKALTEFATEINELRSKFDDYRPEELQNVSVQAFTEKLKTSAEETEKILTTAGCNIPEGYFLGFEQYRGQLANSGATGVLMYQVEAMEKAMMQLAEARPSQLIRIYREPVPEETGEKFTPEKNDVARQFGFEVTFKGSENSVREFLSALGTLGDNYFTVRCVEIVNERDTPPRTIDAKFESAVDAPAQNAGSDNAFGDAFELPGGDAFGDEPTDGEPEVEVPAVPEAPAADSSRILAQVLGNEELIVMVRFDLALFLPSNELPKL